jgi:uncharacterized membrane protein YeaQ/YmgE (transglycosylase-associated protein family)
MNVTMWMLIGSALGWITFSYFGFNENRGAVVSMIIGALGGYVGGHVVAPMFTAGALAPGEFSMPALLFAAAIATAFVAAGNLIHRRWGV